MGLLSTGRTVSIALPSSSLHLLLQNEFDNTRFSDVSVIVVCRKHIKAYVTANTRHMSLQTHQGICHCNKILRMSGSSKT